ncbi:HlyD family efflux transporter periplasmic adaptor subunit [Patescibacteria group bacterium]|nr:HlyD family efflux transporter periplasmic adaptor subunit [Patescibacteria group bacterium]
MSDLRKKLLKRKSLLIAAAVILLGAGGIWAKTRTPQEPTRYVLASVGKQTIITSITGSGQVSGQNQVDIKPVISAEITKILVTAGQSVSSSQILMQLDPKEAQKTIRDAARGVSDAQISLASAELSLKKLQQPVDSVSLIQAENSLRQAERTLDELREPADPLDLRQAEAEVEAQLENTELSSDRVTPQIIRDAYDDAVPTLKTISQTITQTLYSADDVLGIDRASTNDSYERFLSAQDSSKLDQTKRLYEQARIPVRELKTLTENLQASNAPIEKIEEAIRKTQGVLQQMGPLTQGVYDALQNTVSSVALSESSLNSLKNTAQSDHANITNKLTSLTSLTQSLESARSAFSAAVRALDKARLSLDKLKQGPTVREIASAEERVTEAKASLAKLKRGTDPLDLLSSQNTISQRRASVADAQNKLRDAQETLANYTIRAPFDGIIAKLPVKEKDSASQSTVLATILTHAKIAQITLNEVDVSKVKLGQKATLTFDALPDLTIAGNVSEVDSIGTVTQGVVNYSVKILFVTQDDRIKPGMSVSASIITDIRSDVLAVPNAALSNGSMVQLLRNASPADVGNTQGIVSSSAPERQTVEIGLANEQYTEVTSGLQENQLIVIRTIEPSAQTATARTGTATGAQGALGGLRIQGLGGAAGGNAAFGGGVRPVGR